MRRKAPPQGSDGALAVLKWRVKIAATLEGGKLTRGTEREPLSGCVVGQQVSTGLTERQERWPLHDDHRLTGVHRLGCAVERAARGGLSVLIESESPPVRREGQANVSEDFRGAKGAFFA